MKKEEKIYQEDVIFECDCHDLSHTFRISYDKEFDEVILETHLYQYNGFLRRIWLAIKYILGIESKCGHYDCIMLSGNRLAKFQRYIKNLPRK